MDARISRLLVALGQARNSAPEDIRAFLEALPDAGSLPSPWETWTLIGLVRHRDRQYWVREIVNTRLNGDSAALGAECALGHPAGIPQSGSVAGMPNWEYYFHGRGCCLTYKATGEVIDVDFWDDSAEYFDVYFYARYLESLRHPGPPELRLLELHRSVCHIRIAVGQLFASGALSPLPGRDSHPLRVHEDVLARGNDIEALCLAWPNPANRVWLAGLIGDWPAAHAAATRQQKLHQITGPRAERCRAIRRELLLRETGHRMSEALYGLAELDAADDRLESAFLGPPSGVVSAALDIVGRQDDPRWCPQIYALFKRMNPAGQIPEPHIWMSSLKFLLRHSYKKDEVIASLPKARGAEMGQGVLLALEHAPEHALLLIRKAMLSDIPCNRTAVAAILALIAEPWSMRELLRALEASDDQEETADARAALLEIGDRDAEMAVRRWEEKNPHEDEIGHYIDLGTRRVGPFHSIAEHVIKSRGSRIRYEMDQLRDRVMAIKDIVSTQPPALKPWWEF